MTHGTSPRRADRGDTGAAAKRDTRSAPALETATACSPDPPLPPLPCAETETETEAEPEPETEPETEAETEAETETETEAEAETETETETETEAESESESESESETETESDPRRWGERGMGGARREPTGAGRPRAPNGLNAVARRGRVRQIRAHARSAARSVVDYTTSEHRTYARRCPHGRVAAGISNRSVL
ncbi:MAG: hypothetical protein KBG48_29080 [Kofleriaceae bacterium]|nr:hypothetical protein [Kofleriaceae bacterium]